MRNCRICQHALDVGLQHRDDIAQRHRQDGQQPQNRAPVLHQEREGLEQNPHQRRKSGSFRSDGHEGRYGRRRAFVNIRHPGMEWHQGHFESETDQQQSHPDQRCGLNAPLQQSQFADRLVIGAPGAAVNQRDPVKKNRGGKGAEQEIFQRRFVGARVVALEAGKNVGRDGKDFYAKKREDEVARWRPSETCRSRRTAAARNIPRD